MGILNMPTIRGKKRELEEPEISRIVEIQDCVKCPICLQNLRNPTATKVDS